MLIIFLLILLNGLFAMSEIAIVSARKVRLQKQASSGDVGAQVALELADAPHDFLSTVQIGITLISVMMGAFGGSQLATQLASVLVNIPFIGVYSQQLAFGLVVVLITYLSLVFGELAPKQIGLSHAERVASKAARPLQLLATITAPLVALLSFSTRTVIKFLPISASQEPPITEEELQMMMEEGAASGVFEPIEEEIVEQLFKVGDQRINVLMTDRTDIVWLDLAAPVDNILAIIKDGSHSRYPVGQGELDNVKGMVYVRDLLRLSLSDDPFDLTSIIRPTLFVPSGLKVYDVLARMKDEHSQIALITDEHGGLEGLVTFNDLLEAIVGDVPEEGDPVDPTAFRRDDGSWLIDGKYPIDAFKQIFEIKDLPEESKHYYYTVGGFVMYYLKRIPNVGDQFEWGGLHYEIVDMDWRRVDKVLVTPDPGRPA